MAKSIMANAWFTWPVVLLLLQDGVWAREKSQVCHLDAGCNAAGTSMLQASFSGAQRDRGIARVKVRITGNSTDLVNVSSQSFASQEPSGAEVEADEPDRAPGFFMNKVIFFVFAAIILIIMLVLLAILECIVNHVNSYQARRLARLDEKVAESEKTRTDADPADAAKAEEADKAFKRRSKKRRTTMEVADEMEGRALWKRLNGDRARLSKLMSFANSEEREKNIEDLIKKVAKAFRLNLSEDAIEQACEGLTVVVRAVANIQRKTLGDFNAREKLQRAIKEVVSMIKVGRAFGIKFRKLEEEDADHFHDHSTKHADHVANKWADGHSGLAHGQFKDRRLGKTWLSAYFASQRWLDHTAIAFVFLYSQLCAFVYAMYLKWRFPRMYAFMGPWLLVSRGEAMAIIIQTVLMIVFLSRGLITRLRPYMHWSTVLQNIADKHVLIHKYLGVMLVICAAAHIVGHLKGSIPAIIGERDASKINSAFTYGTKIRFNFNTWGEALVCFPAKTGYLLVIILLCFWASANHQVRKLSFEGFHYAHLVLIVAWCAALIAHGWKQWLGLGVPVASISVLPAVLYYVIERIVHTRKAKNQTIRISNAVVQKTNVNLEIDTGSAGYAFETGMYCMLKVPEISDFQWHPFTIASGGGTNKFHVLFAVVGDWTTALKELLNEAQKSNGPYPEIHVRGGYGAPALGMKDQKNIVMVGGGVGATPFLSFLSSITTCAREDCVDQFKGIESAVFYWLSRDPVDFAWVNEYNSIIKATDSLKDRVSIKLFLTKSLDVSKEKGDCDAAEVALFWLGLEVATSKFDSPELAHELGVPTNFGRPDWIKEFSNRANELRPKSRDDTLEVAVFVCGNRMLVDSLEEACTAVTDKRTRFRVYAEEF